MGFTTWLGMSGSGPPACIVSMAMAAVWTNLASIVAAVGAAALRRSSAPRTASGTCHRFGTTTWVFAAPGRSETDKYVWSWQALAASLFSQSSSDCPSINPPRGQDEVPVHAEPLRVGGTNQHTSSGQRWIAEMPEVWLQLADARPGSVIAPAAEPSGRGEAGPGTTDRFWSTPWRGAELHACLFRPCMRSYRQSELARESARFRRRAWCSALPIRSSAPWSVHALAHRPGTGIQKRKPAHGARTR